MALESVPPAIDSYGRTIQPDWRLIDWHAHERRLDIDGTAMNFVDIGSGDDAVVFIHGIAGSWRWFLEVMPAVARQRRVIAIDLPGCGGSERPREPWSFDLVARQVDSLCAQLGLRRVTLVGHSIGTAVAAAMAVRHPRRVAGLVLAGGPMLTVADIIGRPFGHNARRRPGLTAVLGYEVATGWVHIPQAPMRALAGTALGRAGISVYFRHPGKLALELLYQLMTPGNRGIVPAARAVRRDGAYADMDRIACPVLIISGDSDRIASADDVRTMLAVVPKSRQVLLSDTGSAPHLERPAEFVAALEQFLRDR